MVTKCTGSFVIGLFAGVCAVFVPRMGSLLGGADLERISIFPAPFVVMGLAFAAIVGAVLAILYYGRSSSPGEQFMAALGVPALLAGALSTSAQTGRVQQLQVTADQLSSFAVAAEQIRKNDTPVDIFPIAPAADKSSAGFERLLGIGTAHAGQPEPIRTQQSLLQSATVGASEPSYALLVAKSASAAAAQQRASQLRAKYPNARAIRAGDKYGVIVDIRPESSAVAEAIRIKRESGVAPELIRLK